MDLELEEHLEELRTDLDRAERDLDAFRLKQSEPLAAANRHVFQAASLEERVQAKSEVTAIRARLQQKEQWVYSLRTQLFEAEALISAQNIGTSVSGSRVDNTNLQQPTTTPTVGVPAPKKEKPFVSPVTPAESLVSYDFRHLVTAVATAGALQTEGDIYDGLSAFPNIVKDTQDQWVELKCPECGANSSNDRYFNGKRGVGAHMRSAHKTEGKYDQVWQKAVARILSEKDIADILSGRVTIEKVEYSPPARPPPARPMFDNSQIVSPTQSDTPSYLAKFGCVVQQAHGQWAELACYKCGANAGIKKASKRPTFFNGLAGLRAHLVQNHTEGLGTNQKLKDVVWEKCIARDLTETEVQELLSGQATIDMKLMDTTTLKSTSSDKAAQATKPGQQASVELGDVEPSGPRIAQKDEAGEDSEEDYPYDYLVNFPTIVLRADGVWVELRCEVCGGNYLPTWDRYIKGALGFTRHMNKAHHITNTEGHARRIAWAVERCSYREISQDEIDVITDDKSRPQDFDIPKIPVNTAKPHGKKTFQKAGDQTEAAKTTSSGSKPEKKASASTSTGRAAASKKRARRHTDNPPTNKRIKEEPRPRRVSAKVNRTSGPVFTDSETEGDTLPYSSDDSVISPRKRAKRQPITISSDAPVDASPVRAAKRHRRWIAGEDDSDVELPPSVPYGSRQTGVTTTPADKASTKNTATPASITKPVAGAAASSKVAATKSATTATVKSSSSKQTQSTKGPAKIKSTTPVTGKSKPATGAPGSASPLKQKQASTSSGPTKPAADNNTTTKPKENDTKIDLSLYCPCNLQGHACRSPRCKLREICTRPSHDSPLCTGGAPSHAHDTVPSCLSIMLNDVCDEPNCDKGHDQTEERTRICDAHDQACLEH